MRNILPRRGITARPEQVLLTLGAQNALWIASHVLLGFGRRAVIENPCYPGLRAILNQMDCTVTASDIDKEGLLPAESVSYTHLTLPTNREV